MHKDQGTNIWIVEERDVAWRWRPCSYDATFHSRSKARYNAYWRHTVYGGLYRVMRYIPSPRNRKAK